MLGFISLQTGAEFISLMLVLNKLTGFYGILAIFTGYELSFLQFSTYLYSILVLVSLAILVPHLRKQSPLECLLLAWIYILDTIINCACTTFFAVLWFLGSGSQSQQQSEAVGQPDDPGSAANTGMQAAATLKRMDATMPHDTAFSIVLITAVTLIRVYFSLVIASYAHQVLLRYVDRQVENDRPRAKDVNGPFAVGRKSVV